MIRRIRQFRFEEKIFLVVNGASKLAILTITNSKDFIRSELIIPHFSLIFSSGQQRDWILDCSLLRPDAINKASSFLLVLGYSRLGCEVFRLGLPDSPGCLEQSFVLMPLIHIQPFVSLGNLFSLSFYSKYNEKHHSSLLSPQNSGEISENPEKMTKLERKALSCLVVACGGVQQTIMIATPFREIEREEREEGKKGEEGKEEEEEEGNEPIVINSQDV
ncbi:uncharacterized protein MONOS_13497 [Monocercomonoides exilis]|uniref:uncharacterized protein n=1 Tax=Monocercomonoides exilis TaxID=2049356 RepID=UPI0035596F22|nr:hypothetical protein MONOS_13497 [Monocercomonoides exilis]|eukprot:MONOS_13497.1-p1 / transcript=MONOS_13497.1 / gene=MONOS_13497 / organism=Monocercomonoides_exilis_PA203 / gene_product=unspecified product / transcript_product=unspecified product / location=Mono_scaffold00836:25742-26472(-) / protein_length=219 / sequence_SO=supercontig / SO=protein_coding / is_pseudo=false